MADDLDELVDLNLASLDTMETGPELTRGDFALLALTGIVMPVVLLLWGWL